MIKINLVCVGSLKEDYLKKGCEEFIKRLGRFCDLKIITVPEKSYASIDKTVVEEGQLIEKHLKGFVVLFEITGNKMDSKQFAELIKNKKNQEGVITFVIGGSNGVSEVIKNKVNLKISFSDFTLPHQLFRLIVLEQIYRAFSINENISYHK